MSDLKQKKNKSSNSKFRGLGFKLFAVFTSILLVVLTIVGVSVNLKSKAILKEVYVDSIKEIIEETSEVVEMYFEKFDLAIETFAINPNVKNFGASLAHDKRLEEFMDSLIKTDDDIMAMYFVTNTGNAILYPGNVRFKDPKALDSDWYVNAVESGEFTWSKPYADEFTGKQVITVTKVVTGVSDNVLGVVGIDIELTTIQAILNDIKIGEFGYPVLIDTNFVTLTHKDEKYIGKKVPVPEITEMISSKSDEAANYSFENSDGKKQDKFAVYSDVPHKDLHILATMGLEEITESINSILIFVVAIAIVSLIVSMIVSQIFAKGISNTIKKLLKSMEAVKNGDLSIDPRVKSNDEIGTIGEYFAETVKSLGGFLLNVRTISDNLTESAQNLAATAEETSASADEVSRTVDEIAKGASEQASDAESSALVATSLSDKFVSLSENAESLQDSTQKVVDANSEGLNAISELQEKTTLSENANKGIEIVINELDEKTQFISNILDAISSIAEQTNLLALNASIEAARAGEHGRGFAVVADEIRKLAEESSKSAEDIREIVTNIQVDSKKTVTSMNELKEIASEQSNAVQLVGGAFETISSSVEEMSSQIDTMGNSVRNLEKDKDEIVDSIDKISAVSEETAAASEEVSATMDQQTFAVEEVAKAAEVLNEISANIKVELEKFKLE